MRPAQAEHVMTESTTSLTPRPVAASLGEHARRRHAARRPRTPTSHARVAEFEQVELDGERCVVKYVDADRDFTLRAMGLDPPGLLRVWELGLMDVAAEAIDHAVLAAASWGATGASRC